MDFDFDTLQPGTGSGNLAGLDLAKKRAIPQSVVGRFKSVRGLGKAVKRATDGTAKVRTIDGTVYFIPVLPDAAEAVPAENNE